MFRGAALPSIRHKRVFAYARYYQRFGIFADSQFCFLLLCYNQFVHDLRMFLSVIKPYLSRASNAVCQRPCHSYPVPICRQFNVRLPLASPLRVRFNFSRRDTTNGDLLDTYLLESPSPRKPYDGIFSPREVVRVVICDSGSSKTILLMKGAAKNLFFRHPTKQL